MIQAFGRLEGALGKGGGWRAPWVHESVVDCSFDKRLRCSLRLNPSGLLSCRILDDLSSNFAAGQLTVFDSGDGEFQLFLFLDPQGPFIAIEQDKDKRIAISHYRRGVTIAKSAESFAALQANEAAYVNDELFPLLDYVGILPLHVDPGVVQAALGQLAFDADPDLPARLERLYKDLESDDFNKRDEANQNLLRLGARLRPRVKERLQDQALSIETRWRLTKIAGELPAPDAALQTVEELLLLEDPEFLVPLLSRLKSSGERSLVARRLAALTGTSLEADPAVWNTWWKKNAAAWGARRGAKAEEKRIERRPGSP